MSKHLSKTEQRLEDAYGQAAVDVMFTDLEMSDDEIMEVLLEHGISEERAEEMIAEAERVHGGAA